MVTITIPTEASPALRCYAPISGPVLLYTVTILPNPPYIVAPLLRKFVVRKFGWTGRSPFFAFVLLVLRSLVNGCLISYPLLDVESKNRERRCLTEGPHTVRLSISRSFPTGHYEGPFVTEKTRWAEGVPPSPSYCPICVADEISPVQPRSTIVCHIIFEEAD